MRKTDYSEGQERYVVYKVEREAPLLEWLLENVKGQSRSKVKATLQGRGVLVNGKVVTRFDAPLKPGMTVSVSKRKRDDELRSRYVRIVYEDPYLVVVEKNVGILSMQAGHSTLKPMWCIASTGIPAV